VADSRAMTAAPTLTRSSDEVFFGMSFNPKDQSTRGFRREDLDRELKDPAVFSWIDVQAPNISTLNEILRRWDIDLVLASHFEAPEVLPRIVERPDCLAFYLYEVEEPEHHLDTTRGLSEIRFARMILVLGADFVITYHHGRLDAVDEVKAACEASFRLVGKTPGFIAFLFLQRCLYDYAHLNLANDNALDLLQERVTTWDAPRLQAEIHLAGGNILTLKKLTASLHIVLMLLATKWNRFISTEARASFHEMLANAGAVRGAVDSSRDLLDGIVNAIQATAASRTSEIARVLTVVSSIILPLSLITGIYGMNFEHMPELKWEHGYVTVLAILGVLAGGLLLLFRWLGWVGTGRSSRS
jgi:magnesium transporter